jgi:hypothetical protein
MDSQTGNGNNRVNVSMNIPVWFAFIGLPIVLVGFLLLYNVVISTFLIKIPDVIINSPTVDAHMTMPQSPAPVVNNIVKTPDVTVNNTVPPANVENHLTVPASSVSFSIPTTPNGTSERIVEKVVTKEVRIPVYLETKDKEQAVVTLPDIYSSVEDWSKKYCVKNNLNYADEMKSWLVKWQSRVNENGDENNLANSELLNRAASLNVNSIDPRQMFDMSKLVLRYRDAKLSFPSMFKEHITAENLVKLKTYLESKN